MRSIMTAVLCLSLLAGCGSDDDNGLGPVFGGTFTATFTGDVTGSTSGFATFSGSATDFALLMSNLNATRIVEVFGTGVGRPGTGDHPLTAVSTETGYWSMIIVGEQPDSFSPTSGTLRITSSSPTSLVGTFTITATNEAGTQTITVSGSFSAVCSVDCT